MVIYCYICIARIFYNRNSVLPSSATSCATSKDISPDISRIYNGFIVVTDNALCTTQYDASTASLGCNEKIYYRCRQQWTSE